MNLRGPGLAPLREPGYRLLWTSSIVWYMGRWMDVLVASWLALELTNSPWEVALIGFYRSLPVSLFGAFGGAVADRVDRRVLIAGAGVANVVASFGIAFLYLAGQLQYWQLAVANMLLGLAWAVDFPCRRAILPDLVRRDQILPAMVLDTVSMNVSRALGPLLGGSLLALLSVPYCYGLLGIFYGSSLLPMLFLRLPPRRPQRSISPLRFLGDGLRFCRQSAPVRGVLLITFVMNAFTFPYTQVLSVFARDVLFVGPFQLGLLGAGDGVGSLIGAYLLATNKRMRRLGWAFTTSSVAMSLALVLFSASPIYVLSLAALIAAGIGHAGFSTLQSTVILNLVGEEMRGRVMGLLTLAIGSATLGMLITGAFAGVFGAPLAVGLSALAGAGFIGGIAGLTPGLLNYEPHPAPTPATDGQPSPAR
ncbi:MAG: MFS transporter [Chloroflexota bacterium]